MKKPLRNRLGRLAKFTKREDEVCTRRGTYRVSVDASRLVFELYQLAEDKRVSLNYVVDNMPLRRGRQLNKGTVYSWARGSEPTLPNFENVLHTLGYALKIVPLQARKPDDVA